MTKVYFVRHAQTDYSHEDDRTRPLTSEGETDRSLVLEILRDRKIDVFYCSPYLRSMETIRETAEYYGLEIHTDERLREREKGIGGNEHGLFRKRWDNHDFCEEGGESIAMAQRRNIEALKEILEKNKDKKIVIGTHGTALSTIFNYYNPEFGCNDFLRIIDWMPYIVEVDFEGQEPVSITEIAHIEKEFRGNNRADKK